MFCRLELCQMLRFIRVLVECLRGKSPKEIDKVFFSWKGLSATDCQNPRQVLYKTSQYLLVNKFVIVKHLMF